MNEAFVDFTGGVGEVLYLRQDTPGLFSALRHALAKESLVGATALVRVRFPRRPPPHHHTHTPGPTSTQSQLRGVFCVLLLSFTVGLFSLTNQIQKSQKDIRVHD